MCKKKNRLEFSERNSTKSEKLEKCWVACQQSLNRKVETRALLEQKNGLRRWKSGFSGTIFLLMSHCEFVELRKWLKLKTSRMIMEINFVNNLVGLKRIELGHVMPSMLEKLQFRGQ